MSDMISMPKQEWAKLEERARTLARDKSYLQLVNNLMNSLSQVPGLEHTAEAILHSILENLGGTNVALYYPIESRIHYATVYGERKVLDSVDDAMVRAAFERREFVEEVRDFTNTEMMTPVFTKASYWAMPLMVGEQLVGVLKTEGMLMTTAEIRSHLLPFFNYAALILKNEIESYLRFAEAARLAAIVQSTDDAIIGKTLEGAITSWNTGAEKIYGYTASEVVGRSIALLVPPGREDELPQILAQIKEGQHVEHYETMRRRKDGWDIHVSLTVSPIKDGTGCIVGASTIARNITARKRAEEELHRVNRALRMLSDSNQTLIRTTDETGLLNEICRIVVEVGGYRMAWVGFAEYDEAKTVRPVAHAGFESGYLESANLTWADCERGRSPGGIAIRTGQPCIVRSILDDPAFVPWREEAVRRGYQSIIALPLTSEGQTFGALGIYAAEAEVFDAKEVEILKELAGDLTFGIVALRTRAERKQAGEALQSAAVKYRIVADNTYDWEFWLSPADEFIYISPSCKRITGYEADEFRADPGLLGRIVHQDDRPRLAGHRHDMTQRMKPGELEYRIVHADGTIRWIDHVCQPVFDEEGNFLGTRGSNRDITERKRAEAELRRVNRALRAISECNQVLVRASDEAELLHAICQTIVQEGGYRMAWVGFAEQDKKKTLRPVALAGYEEGYIEKGNFTWSDTEEGRGVGGTAIRTGRPAVCQNLLTDSNFARWRDEALKHGYAACLGLPLLSEGKAFGTLAIYSSEPDAFDATEVKLLSEQAEDLAYGIVALRTRAERKLAEEALQDSEQKLKTIVHGSPIPQFVIDRDHRVIYWNKALEEISGIRAEEVTGTSRHWRAFYHAERPCLADLLVDGAVEAIPDWYVGKCNKSKYAADAYEATDYFPMLGEKGKWLYFSAATILDAKGNVIGAVETLEDVTERKRAEEALRESETLHRTFLDAAMDGVITINSEGRVIYFNPAALAMFRYRAEEVMGQAMSELIIPPDMREAYRRGIARYLATGISN
ncbi:MAG: PAS domain S-box protein, partial [Verrucomicrobia bacterium]|nr:PAS domain S-box protein [Verrucomicrobiota bacterium]